MILLGLFYVVNRCEMANLIGAGWIPPTIIARAIDWNLENMGAKGSPISTVTTYAGGGVFAAFWPLARIDCFFFFLSLVFLVIFHWHQEYTYIHTFLD